MSGSALKFFFSPQLNLNAFDTTSPRHLKCLCIGSILQQAEIPEKIALLCHKTNSKCDLTIPEKKRERKRAFVWDTALSFFFISERSNLEFLCRYLLHKLAQLFETSYFEQIHKT